MKNDVFISKADTLASISLNQLTFFEIKGILLDLDNTIISEDNYYLSPFAEDWIKEAEQLKFKLFLLSNGKRKKRVEYWSRRLEISSISPAHKPLPTSFWKAMKQMNLSSKNIVVIGDSLHTDVLGAWLTGCRSIQVASLPHPPRWWEKLFGQVLQIPYPSRRLELWKFSDVNFDFKN